MGDIFSLGFGPFRWICTSGNDQDLKLTDETAQKCFEEILAKNDCKIFDCTLIVFVLKCNPKLSIQNCPKSIVDDLGAEWKK